MALCYNKLQRKIDETKEHQSKKAKKGKYIALKQTTFINSIALNSFDFTGLTFLS